MKWLAVLLSLFLVLPALAQEKPSITAPTGVVTGGASGVIASSNVYQQVLAPLNTQRKRLGCTIVNYGSNTMWVYEDGSKSTVTPGLTGANANATTTKANSVQLSAGQAYYCAQGGIVITAPIFITGTASDAFYAGQQ